MMKKLFPFLGVIFFGLLVLPLHGQFQINPFTGGPLPPPPVQINPFTGGPLPPPPVQINPFTGGPLPPPPVQINPFTGGPLPAQYQVNPSTGKLPPQPGLVQTLWDTIRK